MELKRKSAFYFLLMSLMLNPAFAGGLPEPVLKGEVLAAHHHWRQLHHAPKLHWDKTLQQIAAKHASRCIFKHSAAGYGENLAAGYPSITAAVNAWYAEGALYSFRDPRFSAKTGHFTQLVWASTQTIGCASVVCNGKNGTPGTYLVCEYFPAGNIVNAGYFKKNVLPV